MHLLYLCSTGEYIHINKNPRQVMIRILFKTDLKKRADLENIFCLNGCNFHCINKTLYKQTPFLSLIHFGGSF